MVEKISTTEINITSSNKEEIIKNIVKIDQSEDQDFIFCGKDEEISNDKQNKEKTKKIIDKSKCQKCNINKPNFINKMEYICKDCFIKVNEHKFRSNLRAHCRIRHEDNLLVCLSGGINSMTMLYLFNLSLNESNSTKKLFFKIKFLFIDDSFIHTNYFYNKDKDLLLQEREKNKVYIEELSSKYQFEINILNFESCLDLENLSKSINSQTNFNLIDLLCSKIYSFDDINFRTKYAEILRTNLLSFYAISFSYNKIVLGNSQSNLVNNVFNNIIQGRGSSINTKYVDDSIFEDKLIFLRPMKDFLNKEILLMSSIWKLSIIPSSCLNISKINIKGSKPYDGDSYLLIDSVINNLQERMFSTTPTIISTIEKLKIEKIKIHDHCGFCLNRRDDIVNKLEIGSFDMLNKESIFTENKELCFGCKRMFNNVSLDQYSELIVKFNIFN